MRESCGFTGAWKQHDWRHKLGGVSGGCGVISTDIRRLRSKYAWYLRLVLKLRHSFVGILGNMSAASNQLKG